MGSNESAAEESSVEEPPPPFSFDLAEVVVVVWMKFVSSAFNPAHTC